MQQESNFAFAFTQATSGQRVYRQGWPGGTWIGFQTPDANSKVTAPYFYVTRENGKVYPWIPTNEDLFAGDWKVLN